jgi:hypothetical protein
VRHSHLTWHLTWQLTWQALSEQRQNRARLVAVLQQRAVQQCADLAVLLLLLAAVQQLALSAVVRTLLQGRKLAAALRQVLQAILSPVCVRIHM